jgi:hypothetical protein
MAAAILLLTGITGCEKDREESGIRVMTWNVYVGADIDAILEETDPTLIPVRVAEAWAAVQNTSFALRAEALAAEIARERPHVIGLQEISTVLLQTPGDYLAGNEEEAEDEILNFLDLLRAELLELDIEYSTVAVSTNFDIEMPMLVEPDSLWFDDIRLIDHEVLLVRKGVRVGNTSERYFENNLEAQIGDSTVVVQRGWVSAEVEVAGREYYIVSTHLETAENSPVIQEAQAAEVMEAIGGIQLPIILLGDLNSDADGTTTTSYNDFLAEGFTDAWTMMGNTGSASTCCQLADLSNASSSLNRRIDFVLLKGSYEVLMIKRVGADPEDRTAAGLWPSDHAGLSARVQLP